MEAELPDSQVPPIAQVLQRLPHGGAGVYALSPGSLVAGRIAALIQMHTLQLPLANPQMLEMFAKAERNDPAYSYLRDVNKCFQMEFAGKFLTHAVQLWKVSQDPALKGLLQWFVGQLASIQAENGNGYLSTMPDGHEFNLGPGPIKAADGGVIGNPWDAWGHYHLMTGLLLWHEAVDDLIALKIATDMADLLCTLVGNDPQKLHRMTVTTDGGAKPTTRYSGVNAAIVDSFAWLFRITKVVRYQQFCLACLQEWQLPNSPDFLRQTLKGVHYYELSPGGPRWECLHAVMGLAELAWSTGQQDYATALQDIWWDLAERERKPQGAIMSQEQAAGSPYKLGSQETCCVVAWGALCVKMLCLTGDPLVADELELSLFNAAFMFTQPSGAWITYDSQVDFHQMGGQSGRQNFFTAGALAWQSEPGSSQLGCCTVNGPRVLGLLSEWGLMKLGSTQPSSSGYALNYYGAGTMTCPELTLRQETGYPFDSQIDITVVSVADSSTALALWLRIPAWSKQTGLVLNGKPYTSTIIPGQYLKLTRQWKAGDKLSLQMDFRIRAWTACTDVDLLSASELNTVAPTRVQDTPIHCACTSCAYEPSCKLASFCLPAELVDIAAGGDTHRHTARMSANSDANLVWDSTRDGSWPAVGKHFTGAEPPQVISLPAVGQIKLRPTTMMGWIYGGVYVQGDDISYVWSCGGADAMKFGAKKDDCRALAINPTNACYIGRGEGDMDNILNSDAPTHTAWSSALTDKQSWHHLAVSDDNSHVRLFLDGKLVADRVHQDPSRSTGPGFILGGFADCNRAYVGYLAGVRFYVDCLDAAAINAAKLATMPPRLPPPPPIKTCLYRGPLLLTFDPRFNGLTRHDTSATPFRAVGFGQTPTRVSPPNQRLPCHLLLEFAGAGPGGEAVRLCNCDLQA